jgi:hypothetical protein
MLPRENQLFDFARQKPSLSSVSAGLSLASGFGFCFHCRVGSNSVLRRPIEITAVTGDVDFRASGDATGRELSRNRPLLGKAK